MATQTWTIKKLLDWMIPFFENKGVDAPRLAAEMLLSNVLGLERIQLYMHYDKPVGPDKLAKLRDLVKRAGEHEPVAYLVGHTEFYSMQIDVSPAVLIPRPETEGLVERAIEFLRERQVPRYVLELCTGSGCIAAAVAKGVEDVKVIATDICDEAMEVAGRNVEKHGLGEKVELCGGDLFEAVEGFADKQFDLIVSNPPYVTEAEYEGLDRNVKEYEPARALVAGEKGLDIYERMMGELATYLKPDGAVMLEIGYQQGDAVRELLEGTGLFSEVRIEKDFARHDRIAVAKR
ncbi:Release factor glutamine methyltransferase [Anaerohalosphaera lusitana]|uniref:Release factor glutamine methyltransferase n=1 Tax=Anaerohalosphaera lusitana TaxID=1936003 RepID=A0A1U9NQU8_9BACT|nr:peptide chain release factor N(5)-glutamine methyltransferase [Anaerohalosphaera lusitana]AQT69886.1 Release factor glutamine methyltransferase [Anaerohalosphaera lusitana]